MKTKVYAQTSKDQTYPYAHKFYVSTYEGIRVGLLHSVFVNRRIEECNLSSVSDQEIANRRLNEETRRLFADQYTDIRHILSNRRILQEENEHGIALTQGAVHIPATQPYLWSSYHAKSKRIVLNYETYFSAIGESHLGGNFICQFSSVASYIITT